jgi:hypothetical protein
MRVSCRRKTSRALSSAKTVASAIGVKVKGRPRKIHFILTDGLGQIGFISAVRFPSIPFFSPSKILRTTMWLRKTPVSDVFPLDLHADSSDLIAPLLPPLSDSVECEYERRLNEEQSEPILNINQIPVHLLNPVLHPFLLTSIFYHTTVIIYAPSIIFALVSLFSLAR